MKNLHNVFDFSFSQTLPVIKLDFVRTATKLSKRIHCNRLRNRLRSMESKRIMITKEQNTRV